MIILEQAKGYFEAEDYEKTKKCYEEYIKMNRKEQTEEMAVIYSNLAEVYKELEDLKQAKELHIKSLEIRKSVHGK